MGQSYSVYLEGKIKDEALLVKLTNNYINSPGNNFSENCWDKSDLTTAEGCIRAILAGDKHPDEFRKEVTECGTTLYFNDFYCCYGWESVLYRWFNAVAPAFEDGADLEVTPEEGHWQVKVDKGVAVEV